MDTSVMIYVVDVGLLVIVGLLMICVGARVTHVGWKVGKWGVGAVNAVLGIFAKIYQATLGLMIALVIGVTIYFYATTSTQRTAVHETITEAVPLTGNALDAVVNHDKVAMFNATLKHIRLLASQFMNTD